MLVKSLEVSYRITESSRLEKPTQLRLEKPRHSMACHHAASALFHKHLQE